MPWHDFERWKETREPRGNKHGCREKMRTSALIVQTGDPGAVRQPGKNLFHKKERKKLGLGFGVSFIQCINNNMSI